MIRVAVIGGGAAGMMAAIFAAQNGASVTLFEKMKFTGTKLRITGKGRCNLTNNCEINEIIENIPTNPRFMYAGLSSFTPQDVMSFFEDAGVPLKTERGNRVFPISDKASDIVDALRRKMREHGVKVVFDKVTEILIKSSGNGNEISGIKTVSSAGILPFDRVILATGGLSYPRTGSDGDGHRFAEKLGIKVTKIRPSLVPLETLERHPRDMQGLALKNVSVKALEASSGKVIYEDFGEMLFTHFGLSGPTILSMSAHLPDITAGKYKIVIDLKPALDEKTLDKRLISDFEKGKNKNFINALSELLPSKMIPVFVKLSGIMPEKKVNSITKVERARILSLLKSFELTIKSARSIDEAIITSGGIDAREINPKTMESKSVSGLYFAGEIIDVDAYTGGFNLQIAWSSGRLAGISAAQIR
ncbi:MAG: NAD(P)/FAD-dependent oxidoreductase [Ruminococcaceae bacterium]|nr:NAD(P)/FAD-dependent oxidoreductase [Oscillospiraceae bacterium]